MSRTREKRKRAHIKLSELLASALSDLLTDDECNILRAQKVSAQEVISLFTPDHHPVRHAEGGSDLWWNLKMRRRGVELKAKDNRDTSEIAKNDRISAAERDRLQAQARKLVGPSPFEDMEIALVIPPGVGPSRHQVLLERAIKRRIPSRPFPQGRKLQSRNTLRRP